MTNFLDAVVEEKKEKQILLEKQPIEQPKKLVIVSSKPSHQARGRSTQGVEINKMRRSLPKLV
jgi:hypothetical protein